VFDAVVQLDLDDFDAAPRVTGYVEPSEAARKAIERAVAPYFNDLKRRLTSG
jgi:ribosomal protein S9